jgi:hypothetical protein
VALIAVNILFVCIQVSVTFFDDKDSENRQAHWWKVPEAMEDLLHEKLQSD